MSAFEDSRTLETRATRPRLGLRTPPDIVAAAQPGASSVAPALPPIDRGPLSAPLLMVLSGAERGPQENALGSSVGQAPARATGIAAGVPCATRRRHTAREVTPRRVAHGTTDAAGREPARVAGGGL